MLYILGGQIYMYWDTNVTYIGPFLIVKVFVKNSTKIRGQYNFNT